jgi:hypothetical protein
MEKIYTAEEYKQLQANCIAAREQNIARQKAFKANKLKSVNKPKSKSWFTQLLNFLCF